MKKYLQKRRLVLLICVVIVVVLINTLYLFPVSVQYIASAINRVGVQFASVLLSYDFKSIAQIKAQYENPKKHVRVLLVPGHEPYFGGAEFVGLFERDMTVELAQNLKEQLEKNPRYKVFVTRDNYAWNPDFAIYFEKHWNDIVAWKEDSRNHFKQLVALGTVTETVSPMKHNSASADVATRLYAINKWSNENNIDIVIHIHFNDNPRKDTSRPGEHSGISVYVPAGQYGNSTTTKIIADSIFNRLTKYNPQSDFPGEIEGVIHSPELIAIGANNTVGAASLLVEYGYIYEPQFKDSHVRSMAIKDLAFQTYLGLQDFFDPESITEIAKSYDTVILPHEWKELTTTGAAYPADIFALQTALMSKGLYPPSNKTKNDCPRTGVFGECTRASLEAIQKKYGIIGENGIGRKTIEVINRL